MEYIHIYIKNISYPCNATWKQSTPVSTQMHSALTLSGEQASEQPAWKQTILIGSNYCTILHKKADRTLSLLILLYLCSPYSLLKYLGIVIFLIGANKLLLTKVIKLLPKQSLLRLEQKDQLFMAFMSQHHKSNRKHHQIVTTFKQP